MTNVPELFGSMVFNEDVMRQRLPADVFAAMQHIIDEGKAIDPAIADTVAAAMKDWAIEKGATHFTHWFQPLTGVTAEKHDAFLAPASGGRAVMEFSGKELIKGEPDASSFPSGGLRATFEARGYTVWDPASYAYVKDGTLFIPTAFCSYTGEALDAKTPLLRSMDALSREGVRLLRLFGDNETRRLSATVGAEQEYFLVDKELYTRRKDLFYTGRTLFGAPAPKGQELEDHYFGPLRTRVKNFMAELDEELWRLGVPAKTKHNEAAPAQHELAPLFVTANMAVDQNLLMMGCMKRIAKKHGLVCLLHEKPFDGVNGSGKHNNWSISTDTGRNLLKPGKTPAENKLFLLMLAAIIEAVDEYPDLLRLSAATAGNDRRLGGDEAPPAVISVFVGEDLAAIVEAIIAGTDYHGARAATVDFGIPSVPTFKKDTTDRNRTSPFAFTGNKFEFRMVGASQNIAMPNVVLNTAVAESFRRFADRLAGAVNFEQAVADLLRETFAAHARVLFNGNGYAPEWQAEAARRGLCNIDNSVDAFAVFTAPKNVALFERHGVMSGVEIASRKEILFENYAKVINIEAQTMAEIAARDVIPAVSAHLGTLARSAADRRAVVPEADISVERERILRLSAANARAEIAVQVLREADAAAVKTADAGARAAAFRDTVLPAMKALRAAVDEMETMMPAAAWPMPTYGDLMFRL